MAEAEGELSLEERKVLASAVIDSFAEQPASSLRLLSSALLLGGGVLGPLAGPLDDIADYVERQDVTGGLATISTARALRLLAADPEVTARLEDATDPPWSTL